MKKDNTILRLAALIIIAIFLMPDIAAAIGQKVDPIVVVAHITKLKGIWAWWGNLYNDSRFYFTLITVESMLIAGALLGLIADFLIGYTGIDLKSRDLAEH
jgi:ABC-type xylose transport system permease subunit